MMLLASSTGRSAPPFVPAAESPATSSRDGVIALSQLLSHAAGHAPAIVLATQREALAEGDVLDADVLFPDNPTLELGLGPRFDGASDVDFDFVAATGQAIEVTGARQARRAAASRFASRLTAETDEVRLDVRRDVTRAYAEAVAWRAREALAAQVEGFASALLEVAQRRRKAGDTGAVEVRLAESELAMAQAERLEAARSADEARMALAMVSGWELRHPPEVGATMPRGAPPPGLAELEAIVGRHPEGRVREARVEEAAARVAVADREGWPVPVFGVQVAREGSAGSPANYTVLGTLAVPLPAWRRGDGERARQRGGLALAKAEKAVAERTRLANLARAHAAALSAAARRDLLEAGVRDALDDSLALLQRGLEAGQFGLLEVAMARNALIQANMKAIDAAHQHLCALADLAHAIGRGDTPW
jgi:cobalt-zinc-cadmium efflux system outer membrane protein